MTSNLIPLSLSFLIYRIGIVMLLYMLLRSKLATHSPFTHTIFCCCCTIGKYELMLHTPEVQIQSHSHYVLRVEGVIYLMINVYCIKLAYF